MTYGTIKAADIPHHNCAEMTCFKYLFYSCCSRFRNRRSSLKGLSVRKSSVTSSSCTGDGGISIQSSQVPYGGSNSTRSRPRESYRALSEDEVLIRSTSRDEIVSYGSNEEKPQEGSAPLISVVDCSEDKPENPVGDIFEKVIIGKKDSNGKKSSASSSRSKTPSPVLEDVTEDVISAAERNKKDSIRTEHSDVERLPAYQSQSQLSTSNVQEASTADATSVSAEDENFESVKVSGDIFFGLSYNYKTAALEVHVKECRNLSPVDTKKNRSDPYVKGYLLPDRSKTAKRKTKVKKHSLNPVFDEVLKFPVSVVELETRTLWLSVWHSHFGRNDFLGEMMLPLGHGTIENYGYKRHVLKEKDKPENPVADIFEKAVIGKKDSNGEKSSASSSRSKTPSPVLEDATEDVIPAEEINRKDSIRTEDTEVERLPAYQSQSQLSTLTVQEASTADATSGSAEDDHFDSVKVSGDIFFGLSYNYKTAALEVHVKECRNLSPVDTKKNRSDPYVKGYLLPDRSKTAKRKTKVKKHSLNPVFDEVLKFPVTVGELATRTLWLSVWHSHFGGNDFLGEMMLPLGHGTIENYGYKRHVLKEKHGKNDSFLRYNGDIVLALKFVPSDYDSPQNQEVLHLDDDAKGELHVLVKEAKNLIAAYSNGTSNPFCKSYLLPEKNKTSKQKSAVIKKNSNPKWNHTFVYSDVTLSDLKERCLELTIWSHDKMSSNSFLGGVRLSLGEGKHQGCDVDWMDSVGEEINLWDAMLHTPGVFTEGSLLLRSQMQKT